MKVKILLAVMLLFITTITAQVKYNKSDFKEKPVWIEMMNDTTANFHETVEAFRAYYENRELPGEPWEKEKKEVDSFEIKVGLVTSDPKSEEEREERIKNSKSSNKEKHLSKEVRIFKGWYFGSLPWVREDGSIVGPKEQQSIVDKQKRELLEIEKKNNNKK